MSGSVKAAHSKSKWAFWGLIGAAAITAGFKYLPALLALL